MCVNDMRASERTCERMYVRVSVRASKSVSVRAFARSLATRARTYENKVDLSRPYFCTTLPFFTFLVLWRFARTEIRSIKVDWSRPYFHTCARAASERANARTYARTSVHLYAHVRSLIRLTFVTTSVSHSYPRRKTIVYEALKKANIYIYLYIIYIYIIYNIHNIYI